VSFTLRHLLSIEWRCVIWPVRVCHASAVPAGSDCREGSRGILVPACGGGVRQVGKKQGEGAGSLLWYDAVVMNSSLSQ
jgi:hypothetical protein